MRSRNRQNGKIRYTSGSSESNGTLQSFPRLGIVLAVAATLFASCERSDVPTEPTTPDGLQIGGAARGAMPAMETVIAQVRARPLGSDDFFLLVADQEPSFAGLHMGDDGRVNLSLVDLAGEGRAVAAIAEVFSSRPQLATGARVLRQVQYSWLELYDWKLRLYALTGVDGALELDIDQVQNRLSVTIRDEGVRANVYELVDRLGIPREAVVTRVGRLPTLMKATTMLTGSDSLRERLRPVAGGSQIDGANNPFVCTLGFVARGYHWQTSSYKDVFATNGHCMPDWGDAGDDSLYQSDPTEDLDYIGNERWQAHIVSKYEVLTCPVYLYECRLSDVAFGVFESVVSRAKALWGVVGGRQRWASSLVVDDTLTVTGNQLAPMVNDTVNKIGRTTGWTYGPLLNDCITNTAKIEGFYWICHYKVAAGTDAGDSGSAVFLWDGDDDLQIAGQLWGGATLNDTTYFYFQDLNHLHVDLNMDDGDDWSFTYDN